MWYQAILNPTVLKFVVGGILVVSGVFYYKYTQNKIALLSQEKAILEFSIKEQRKVIDSLQKDIKLIVQARDQLSSRLAQSQREINQLKDTLYRENQGKKSLEELAREKPQLIENLVNNATKKVFDCFENIIVNKDCP